MLNLSDAYPFGPSPMSLMSISPEKQILKISLMVSRYENSFFYIGYLSRAKTIVFARISNRINIEKKK
jgi:hypothetical protein